MGQVGLNTQEQLSGGVPCFDRQCRCRRLVCLSRKGEVVVLALSSHDQLILQVGPSAWTGEGLRPDEILHRLCQCPRLPVWIGRTLYQKVWRDRGKYTGLGWPRLVGTRISCDDGTRRCAGYQTAPRLSWRRTDCCCRRRLYGGYGSIGVATSLPYPISTSLSCRRRRTASVQG